ALVSYGSASKVVDPVEATREFERQISNGISRALKEKNFHPEKEAGGYKNCTLTQIPTKTLDELYKDWTDGQKRRAEKEADEAKDEGAKKQWQDAMNFWSDMEKSGLAEK
ncbi:MAG: hypothetical protein HQ517_12535, partial [SAR324 cluster bacterium]|nr:hypothetical protein [SAR324 cluster bacterium]